MPPKSPSPDSTAKLKGLLPERILRFLGGNPAFGLDNEEDFNALFTNLIVDLDYRDILEVFDIRDMAEVRWEITRAKDIRRAAIEKILPAVATELLGTAYVASLGKEEMAKNDVELELTIMFRAAHQGDKGSRQSLEALAKSAGLTNRMLQHEVYCRVLSEIAALDERIVKLELRFDHIVKRFENRRKNLGAMSRSLLHSSRTVDIDVPIENVREGGAKT